MPTMTLRSSLTPPGDRAYRLARAAALLAKGAIAVVAVAGLALFVAAPMFVGMSWPPGATELLPAKQALSSVSAGARPAEPLPARGAGR